MSKPLRTQHIAKAYDLGYVAIPEAAWIHSPGWKNHHVARRAKKLRRLRQDSRFMANARCSWVKTLRCERGLWNLRAAIDEAKRWAGPWWDGIGSPSIVTAEEN